MPPSREIHFRKLLDLKPENPAIERKAIIEPSALARHRRLVVRYTQTVRLGILFEEQLRHVFPLEKGIQIALGDAPRFLADPGAPR